MKIRNVLDPEYRNSMRASSRAIRNTKRNRHKYKFRKRFFGAYNLNICDLREDSREYKQSIEDLMECARGLRRNRKEREAV